MWKGQHLHGEEDQRGLGEASYCGLCRAKTVRDFVDTNFCQGQGFVDAEVLSTPRFCQRRGFVDAKILSTPRFSRRLYFLKILNEENA
jgi:hypothetical protein